MKRSIYLFLVVLCEIWNQGRTTIILDKYDLQEMCFVDGDKIVSPEEIKNATGYCGSWKSRCCTVEDAEEIYTGKRIQFDPCEGRKMSIKCRHHFERKMCFQDCSPYLAPWLLNLNQTRRLSQFRYLPLCRAQCERWWEDCKHDWAKRENWYIGKRDANDEIKCETIEKKYRDSTYFCEHAFDPFEFLVVPDYTECISILGNLHNNRFVAMAHAEKAFKEKSNIEQYIKLTPTQDTTQSASVPTKFLILCFFLGGVIAAIGFVLGCLLLTKCKSTVRRSTSHTLLFDNRDDFELHETSQNSEPEINSS